MVSNRRAFVRAPHGGKAVVATARGDVRGKILDVSVAGAGLEVPGTFQCGDFVRLRLQVPSADGRTETWIDPDGLVVRVEPTPMGASIVGLSFVGVPSGGLELLSSFVSSKEKPTSTSIVPKSKAQARANVEVKPKAKPAAPSRPQASPCPAPSRRPEAPARTRSNAEEPRTTRSELRDLFAKALSDLDGKPGKRR